MLMQVHISALNDNIYEKNNYLYTVFLKNLIRYIQSFSQVK